MLSRSGIPTDRFPQAPQPLAEELQTVLFVFSLCLCLRRLCRWWGVRSTLMLVLLRLLQTCVYCLGLRSHWLALMTRLSPHRRALRTKPSCRQRTITGWRWRGGWLITRRETRTGSIRLASNLYSWLLFLLGFFSRRSQLFFPQWTRDSTWSLAVL